MVDLKRNQIIVLLAIEAFGSFVTTILFCYWMIYLGIRKARVFSDNQEVAKKAASKLILPCYRPFYVGLTIIYTLLSIYSGLLLISPNMSDNNLMLVLQFYSLCVLSTLSICPLLFTQKFISLKAIRTTALIILPWYAICLALLVLEYEKIAMVTVKVIFLFITFLPPFILSVAILTRVLPSRVRLESVSHRNAVEHYFVFTILFSLLNLLMVISPSDPNVLFPLLLAYTILACIWVILFPLALHRSLLADTKYWNGWGKHNQGIDNTQQLRPDIEFQTAAYELQQTLQSCDDMVLNFEYLEARVKIGEGATCQVFSGRYRTTTSGQAVVNVAIKFYTPNDKIDTETLQQFIDEGKVSQHFRHRNIVCFYGICVCPPQIAFVSELCDKGSLKTYLQKDDRFPHKWKNSKKYQAIYDACAAVEYIHSKDFIHRDIKTENFFVITASNIITPSSVQNRQSRAATQSVPVPHSSDIAIKLGDFGETKLYRTKASLTEGERLPMGGTPGYQAPELLDVKKYGYYYSKSVDIYALGICMWEIWMGGISLYNGLSVLDINRGVMDENLRPDIHECVSTGASPKFIEVMEKAWSTDPDSRPTAKELMKVLDDLMMNAECDEDSTKSNIVRPTETA